MDYNKTDPEFVERVTHFISEEVKKEPGQELDDSTRYLAVLAALAGCQGTGVYEELLPIALDAGLSPVAVKEMVYQSVDYLGLGLFSGLPTRSWRGGGSPFLWNPRLLRIWKTAWKRGYRLRQRSSATR